MARYSRHHNRLIAFLNGMLKLPAWKLLLGVLVGSMLYVFVFQSLFLSPRNTLIWKAIFGEPKYPEGYYVQGVDVSHYQGDINWEKLKAASIDGNPISFVIIKGTEGNSLLDENFNDNFYNAGKYGFIRGAYHYFVPGVDARRQAEYFLKQVHLEDGDFPPVLDFEKTGDLTPHEVARDALTWLRAVEKQYHAKPILYTYYKFKLKYFSGKEFDSYPYWIAHYYVDTLRYKGPWKLWQHTDYGKIDGIPTRVDLNVYNGSMYDLSKFTLSGGAAEEAD